MQSLKIFYVIDAYDGPSGGTEKQLLMLIRGMMALGHEVRLFVLRHTPYTISVSDFPCAIECLEADAIRSLATFRRMRMFRARVRAERPDIVHAFFNDAAILVPLYCKTEYTRVFTSRRDMGYWYTRLNLGLLRLANRRVDRIICNSMAVAAEVTRREAVSANKLAVAYNGLVVAQNPESSKQLEFPLTGVQPGGNPIWICLLANLRPIKRIEDFIQAAARLSRHVPACRFLVVGESLSSSYEQELTRLVASLELGEKFHFTGLVADPMALLRHCHVGVLTSMSEGLSNSILEYMAAGLPVVCSDVGGNGELVAHGTNGFLYPAGDVDALARHLLHLIKDEDERRRIGAASLQKARDFSPERMVESNLRVYARRETVHA